MIKFLSSLGIYRIVKVIQTDIPPPNDLAAKTFLTRLGQELNMDWKRETGNLFLAASILSTLHQPYQLERGGRPVSHQFTNRCFQRLTNLVTAYFRAAIQYLVYRRRLEHDVKHVIFRYFARSWRLAGLQDKAKPIPVLRGTLL